MLHLVRARSIVLIAALVVTVAGCGGSSSPPAAFDADAVSAVKAVGRSFVDSYGRQVIFRGYNARIDGLFQWDTSLGGHGLAPFGEAEAQRFEELGLDVLRMCVNWSGIEPQPGVYDSAYLDRADAVIELGRKHGFHVLVDMHQDGFATAVGDDGAPSWAIVPPGTAPPGHAVLNAQSALATVNFFRDYTGPDGRSLQDAWIAAAQQIARRHVGDPVIAGYEAYNEPAVPNNGWLDSFNQRFGRGIRAVDPDANVFFEPLVLRNDLDWALIPASPWPLGGGVYAPHVYTTVFSSPFDGYATGTIDDLAPSMQHAEREADGWGAPLFVTELGNDQSNPNGPRFLHDELDLQDQLLASSTIWVWQEQGTWGLFDTDRAERPDTAFEISRPFPRAVAGELLSIERPEAGHMVVRYRATAATGRVPHEISASSAYLASFEVSCDGAPAVTSTRTGRVLVTCPEAVSGSEHTLELDGTTAR